MLTVKLDAKAMEQWADELSQRGFRNAIRRAIDRSATATRRVALDIIAKDFGGPKAGIKDAVAKVKRTTQTNLSESFTTANAKINILATSSATISPGHRPHYKQFRLSPEAAARA